MSNPIQSAGLTLALLLTTAGCALVGDVDTTLYPSAVSYPPTEPGEIKVYEQKPPGTDWKEMGEIRVEYAERWKDVERVFRNKAADAGGHAVYILNKDTLEKDVYSSAPIHHHGYHDPFGYHYGYGVGHYGYAYHYPNGFRMQTKTLINATGVIIRAE